MDLIRIFIDTAFARVSRRYLEEGRECSGDLRKEGLMISEPMFVDECRLHHPELSDDQIRTIYSLYRDEWAHDPENLEEDIEDFPNIFNVIFSFAGKMLRVEKREPLVRFRNLFRWREVTQMIGEDFPVAAFLAYKGRYGSPAGLLCSNPAEDRESIDFCGWPNVLHNDNPHLRHIFESNGLTELHSHLKASTDHFTISWVCLMNRVIERRGAFREMVKNHGGTHTEPLSGFIHDCVMQAADMRLRLWRFLKTGDFRHIMEGEPGRVEETDTSVLQAEIDAEYEDTAHLDYIPYDVESPMGVFAGERRFLYAACEYILRGCEINVTRLFYRYILIKNYFRSYIIQVNDNNGFANFQRHQNSKSLMLTNKYSVLTKTVPFWEAGHFNYVRNMETRIAPYDDQNSLDRSLRRDMGKVEALLKDSGRRCDMDWSYIFHFIKKGNDLRIVDGAMRDGGHAARIHDQSVILKRLTASEKWRVYETECLRRIRGIDAASSEIGCRPEIFAQSFRYLKSAGFGATFHVGEDFYDIVDGLRAIQEAVFFLGLESGDRLGHALALGISPERFYSERHNMIALPMQWMLDNVTWLYFKSKEYNITLPPATEEFLQTTFEKLCLRIGYCRDNETVDMRTYYDSMRLRGDDPKIYVDDSGALHTVDINDTWSHYDKVDDEKCREIRRDNGKACKLLIQYQSWEDIKRKGIKVQSYQLPEGYASTVRKMQEAMMKEVSKKGIGIECCPSSNVRIGYFRRFDEHPILRFFPPGAGRATYPLTVTVNTDDLGVFGTSLPNEFSLLALGVMKMKDSDGNHLYSSQEIYDWIERIIENSEKYCFRSRFV